MSRTPENRIQQYLRGAAGTRSIAQMVKTLKLDEPTVKTAVRQLLKEKKIKTTFEGGSVQYALHNDPTPYRAVSKTPRVKAVKRTKTAPTQDQRRQLKADPPHKEVVQRVHGYFLENLGHHKQVDVAKALGFQQHLVEPAIDSLINQGRVRTVSLANRIFTAAGDTDTSNRWKPQRRKVRPGYVEVVGEASKVRKRAVPSAAERSHSTPAVSASKSHPPWITASPSQVEVSHGEALDTEGHEWKLPKAWTRLSTDRDSVISLIPEKFHEAYGVPTKLMHGRRR